LRWIVRGADVVAGALIGPRADRPRRRAGQPGVYRCSVLDVARAAWRYTMRPMPASVGLQVGGQGSAVVNREFLGGT